MKRQTSTSYGPPLQQRIQLVLHGLYGVFMGLTSVTRFIRPEAVSDTWLGQQITWASRFRFDFVA
jgi:hypothetical protein